MTFTIKPTAGRGGFAESSPSFNPNTPVATMHHRTLDHWEAWHVGDTDHVGCGATEADAIADLNRLDGERADYLQAEQDAEKDRRS